MRRPRPEGPERPGRRRLVALALVAGLLLARQLLAPWLMVRTDVGADGVGAGTFPVVEVAGLGSRGTGFAALTDRLERDGVPVLDFDPDQAGVQPLLYRPTSGRLRIPDLAEDTVAPAIAQALTRAGYDPDTQVVDVVAHSTGGLAVRHLVEQVPGWAARVDDLVMVAVPNHGSTLVWLETRGGAVAGLGADMRPGSAFLDGLGYAEPPGEVYTTVGGDPLPLNLLTGGHGFDDQVAPGSTFLSGAARNVYPSLHGRLLRNDGVVGLVAATLRAG